MLFGSVARGDQHAHSDVDMLYEFEEGAATLDHFLALQTLLEDIVGRPVDLVSKKYISAILRRAIGNDVVPILQTQRASHRTGVPLPYATSS